MNELNQIHLSPNFTVFIGIHTKKKTFASGEAKSKIYFLPLLLERRTREKSFLTTIKVKLEKKIVIRFSRQNWIFPPLFTCRSLVEIQWMICLTWWRNLRFGVEDMEFKIKLLCTRLRVSSIFHLIFPSLFSRCHHTQLIGFVRLTAVCCSLTYQCYLKLSRCFFLETSDLAYLYKTFMERKKDFPSSLRGSGVSLCISFSTSLTPTTQSSHHRICSVNIERAIIVSSNFR